jgi:hypothetical protein
MAFVFFEVVVIVPMRLSHWDVDSAPTPVCLSIAMINVVKASAI